MRGEHAAGLVGVAELVGIIPACAGSTPSVQRSTSAFGDHPRVRGEHSSSFASFSSGRGSSPRARGAPPPGSGRTRTAGIIPACAGSTTPCWRAMALRGDHPRVRGEHSDTPALSKFLRWIIPACAGSTKSMVMSPGRAWDHPRVRGEHIAAASPVGRLVGSSPRARGAHRSGSNFERNQGIIPACAGSTSRDDDRSSAGRDHPRVRGEHCFPGAGGEMAKGSSPRARGAPYRRADQHPRRGIIPACAGSTGHPAQC